MSKHTNYAICLDNEGYEVSLELRKLYLITAPEVNDPAGYLRIIDESGEDYLYPADWFAMVEVPGAVQDSILRAA